MKGIQSLLAYVALSLLFALAFGAGTTCAAQEASTPSETSATCCAIRVTEFNVTAVSARIVVQWIRSDGSVKEERGYAVTDGDPEVSSDNWLWGSGIAPEPMSLMRSLMFAPGGESGTLPARFQKRVLTWLRDNGRIGANEITIP